MAKVVTSVAGHDPVGRVDDTARVPKNWRVHCRGGLLVVASIPVSQRRSCTILLQP